MATTRQVVTPEEVFSAGNLPMRPTVQEAQVFASVGLPKRQLNRAVLQPLQRAGLQLALGVGLVITAATIFVLMDYSQTRPLAPKFTDLSQAKVTVDNFKALNEVNLDRATRLFDLVVAKTFLPVFTGILGYIFGSREERKKEEDNKGEKPE